MIKKREALLLLVLFTGFCVNTYGAKTAESTESDDSKIGLILNVDDAGMSPATIEGIVQLWKQKAVSSTTIIVYSPDFDHTAAVLRGIDIPVGIHLGLHHGPGVLPASEVPSLHAPDGSFWSTVSETMEHMVLAEAEAEFDAQIRKAIDAGLRPVYLDSHMGLIYRNRELIEMYVRLAKKYRVSLALPAGALYDEAREDLKSVGLKSSITLSGVYDIPGGETLENRTEAYRALLKSLKPGLNYCFSHPVPDIGTMREAFGDYPLRIDDFTLFMSPEWKQMLDEAGVTLVSLK